MCLGSGGTHHGHRQPQTPPSSAADAHAQALHSIASVSVKDFARTFTGQDCDQLASELTNELRSGFGLYGDRAAEEEYYSRCMAEIQQQTAALAVQRVAEEKQWDEYRAKVKKEKEEAEANAMDIDAIETVEAYKPKKKKKKSMQKAQQEQDDEEKEWLGDYEKPKFDADYVYLGLDGDGRPRYMHIFFYFGKQWQSLIDIIYGQTAMAKPPHMHDDPHEWQLKGTQQAHYACESQFRAFLCGDGMGLGKTLLGVLAMWLVKDLPGLSLVLAPKAVCSQWEETINNAFETGYEMRAFWLQDPRMTAHELYAGGYDVIVVSYEFLEANMRDKRDLPAIIESYLRNDRKGEAPTRPNSAIHSDFWRQIGLPFKRVLLDEGQKVNKHHTARHIAAKNIHCKAYIILSGTLMHNKWHDISGMLDFVQSHPFTDHAKFMHAFSDRDYTGRLYLPASKMVMLQRFLQPFLISRPASLIQLKELTRRRVPFRLNEGEESQIDQLMADYQQAVAASKASGKKSRIDGIDFDVAGFGILVRAQLASLHPLFAKAMVDTETNDHDYDPNKVEPDDEYQAAAMQTEQRRVTREEWLAMIEECATLREDSGRLDTLLKLYRWLRKDYPQKKMVIFSQYLRFQDIVAHAFLRYLDIEVLRFDGTTTEERRKKVRLEFQSCDPAIPLLMTSGAGSVGLNITEASIVIQLEPWWNGNNEGQTISRAYRQGQEDDVIALVLLATNSLIDTTIMKTRDTKTMLIADVMRPLVRDHTQGPEDIQLHKVPNAHPYKFEFPEDDA